MHTRINHPVTQTRVTIGCSGCRIFRLEEQQGAGTFYLKIASDSATEQLLAEEEERLAWAVDHVSVPRVLDRGRSDGYRYLLTEALPGENLVDMRRRIGPKRLVEMLAEGLHQLHAVPIKECPFVVPLDARIEEARHRMEMGWVDDDDFDEKWKGCSPRALFDLLVASLPGKEEPVVAHGDYCLPNVLAEGERISGFVDLGRLGVMDRYEDLATISRSITLNLGSRWVPYFHHCYGISTPDADRIRFYQMLDEFF